MLKMSLTLFFFGGGICFSEFKYFLQLNEEAQDVALILILSQITSIFSLHFNSFHYIFTTFTSL